MIHNIPDELVALPEVLSTIKVSKSTLYRLVRAGQFPAGTRITAGRVLWRRGQLSNWIDSRFANSTHTV
ncbi:MAG: hypothetical protein B7Y99_08085 [Caulobacterales bacterium 32-69-10]|nr:MAG: hypothetical protein B7Y99_08085 [Caulobacterales bacterium 32-69-10]